MIAQVRPVEIVCVFIAALLALLAVQWRCGAWEREIGFHPDESAHYVTGVMVSEYLRAGASEHPLRFAEQYYIRYPRLAMGHWPPLFPGILGTWILLAGPGRFAVFLLMALLGAGVGTALYALARLETTLWPAAGAVAFWVLFQRQTQIWASSVMAEIPLTLCCLVAVLAYVRYLETERWRPAALFGLAASAALLTKGLGVVLAFVPLPAALAAGKSALVRKWTFWLPAGIVVAVAGPWYALQGSLIPTAFGGALERLSIARLGGAEERFGYLLHFLGPVLTVIVAVALAGVLALSRLRRRCSPLTAVAVSYLAGGVLLHLALPESAEPRHLFHLVPVLLAVAAVGVGRLATFLPAWTAKAGRVALVAAVAVRLAWPGGWPLKPDYALVPLAEELAADTKLDGAVFLVAANGIGEGAFIAEAARLSPDPRWFVLRSSKTLAWVNWAAHGEYITLYENSADIAAYLDSIPVAVVIVGSGQYRTLPHDELLIEALESNPDRWRALDERRSSSHPYRVRVFVSTRVDLKPHGPIQIDMSRRLGRMIESAPEPSLRSRTR